MAEVHVEIIELAEADEHGALHFSETGAQRLRARLREVLLSPDDVGAGVEGFVRAVAAFQASGHGRIAKQLIAIGTTVVEEVSAENAAPAEKLREAVTGATNLAKMRPVGAGEAPEGSLKATAFIRPLPRRKG